MEITHLSYSQYRTYTECPRSWYLGKVRQAEEVQTWYVPLGSAVHGKIEDALKGGPEKPMEDYFYPLITAQMQVEPDITKWLAGGPKDAPVTHEKALQRAVECYERAVQELEDIEVWEVEYDATGALPGLSVPLKAFVDIIGEHKTRGPVIWDWKTGSTKPDNFQLITYAALLDHNRGPSPVGWGRYMMISPTYTSQTKYVDLTKVDPMEVGKKYEAVLQRMKAKHYETKAGFNCRFCFQQNNCMVNAGINPRTTYYDHSTEEGLPF